MASRRPPSALLAAAALWAVSGAAACGAQRLLVVSSSDALPYQQALSGVQKTDVPTEAIQVAADTDAKASTAVAQVGRDGAIVTLGARAMALVAQAGPAVPVVNCMVIGGDDLRTTPGTQVVPLDVPVDTHVAWLKRLLPNARNVGILFDPAQNERRAADSAAALARAGYVPVLEPVSGPTALPNALTRLTNSVDVLHAIPDTTVFAREHSRALLLYSFRHRIPLAGPSEAWVRAGALYAVDWDYQDLGRYCAALALRQAGGAKGPMPPPARLRVVVNARSAEQLRIKWDAETLRAVDKVYE
ncbi:MAG: ABC transporter substrate binding protein [Burkholderiales bacterium]